MSNNQIHRKFKDTIFKINSMGFALFELENHVDPEADEAVQRAERSKA
ncbi:hypothetical protein BH10PSE3_BH10PSE3_36090 [soil metagenome]